MRLLFNSEYEMIDTNMSESNIGGRKKQKLHQQHLGTKLNYTQSTKCKIKQTNFISTIRLYADVSLYELK